MFSRKTKTTIFVPDLHCFFLFFVFLFIWTHGKEELKKFMEKFDNFTTNLRFTYKSIEKEISILDPLVTLSERKGIFTTTYGFI